MCRGKLQERNVQQECTTADFFRQRLGAKHDGSDGIPDRYVRSDIDLLRRVSKRPPDQPVQGRIDIGDEPQ
jgi:hypothetical protein